MKRSKLAAMAAVSAVFVLGAVVGVAVDRLHHSPRVSADAARHHEMALSHLRELFDLDDRQVAVIDSVVRQNQSTVDDMWVRMRPQLQSAIDSVHAQIESVLRPEQREAFREWLHAQGVSPEGHLPAH